MTDRDPAREFLDVIASIESVLAFSMRGRKFTPLKTLAESSRMAGALTEDQYTALIALADLRNALSHEAYRQGSPIATPHQTTIDEARRLLDHLQQPPRALDLLERFPIRSVSPADALATVLAHVQADFSQFPIYDGDTYVGLLTTNAIGRWLAHELAHGDEVRLTTPVSRLHDFAEPSEVAVSLRLDATAAEVIRVLGEDDEPVRAVIFTRNGDVNDSPVAVAVREDVHRLHASIRPARGNH
ncbi:hypothetical protein [Nocardioides renjunii]|uniref:hypothetical protein n=1 Tax=Nocardioides renjunii TaxID=3095075 RepID=UPI002AFEB588|nr:hypothetical protein [Nocardioides sp. S-34]WQQ21984.1 hypothetical protein SHK17_19100 [Nocardioides sp. S-34]